MVAALTGEKFESAGEVDTISATDSFASVLDTTSVASNETGAEDIVIKADTIALNSDINAVPETDILLNQADATTDSTSNLTSDLDYFDASKSGSNLSHIDAISALNSLEQAINGTSSEIASNETVTDTASAGILNATLAESNTVTAINSAADWLEQAAVPESALCNTLTSSAEEAKEHGSEKGDPCDALPTETSSILF